MMKKDLIKIFKLCLFIFCVGIAVLGYAETKPEPSPVTPDPGNGGGGNQPPTFVVPMATPLESSYLSLEQQLQQQRMMQEMNSLGTSGRGVQSLTPPKPISSEVEPQKTTSPKEYKIRQ